MSNVFYDEIIRFSEYDIPLDKDIFQEILNTRKNGFDANRFFLHYVSSEDLANYDFHDSSSLSKFRDLYGTCLSPLQRMGGCNVHPDFLEKDRVNGTIRYAGIKLSDPEKKILGQFDIHGGIITYSPIFPFFYEERDLIKFANDIYFTTIPFQDLVMNQIAHADRYRLHVGDAKRTTSRKGSNSIYQFEDISKDEMIDYVINPAKGQDVLNKYLCKKR